MRLTRLVVLLLGLGVSLSGATDIEEVVKEGYRRGESLYHAGKYREATAEFERTRSIALTGGVLTETLISQQPREAALPAELTPAQALKAPAGATPLPTPTATAEYRLEIGDVLSISVWQWPDLRQDETIVRSDGMISFPLVGEVRVKGRTLTELDHELTERLKEYIIAPEVSVAIRRYGGRKVVVIGHVRGPGVYIIPAGGTMMETLAMAGWIVKGANIGHIVLIRNGKGQRVDLSRALYGHNVKANVRMEPEDIVYVPRDYITNLDEVVKFALGHFQSGVFTQSETEELRILRKTAQ